MAVEKPLFAPVWAEAGETVRPTDAEISEGWPLSATPPSRQRFNWILGWLAQNTAYLRQTGIPPWDAEESYPVDAVVIHNHGLWVAKRENTNVAPGTSPDDWAGAAELLAGSGDLVQKIVAGTGVDISPPEGTGEVTISVTGGSGVQKIVAGSGVVISPAEGTGEVTISATGGGGGGGVIPPDPGGKVADIGAWRIIVGEGVSITGYKDVVTMPSELSDVFAIAITENNVTGWGAPGPDGEVTDTVTAFGTARHADPDKFYLSVATWDTVRNKWYYPGLTGSGGGVNVQYIAIGQNPDYVPPTPAP